MAYNLTAGYNIFTTTNTILTTTITNYPTDYSRRRKTNSQISWDIYPQVESESIDAFKQRVQSYIESDDFDDTAEIFFYLLFEYVNPHKFYAEKLRIARIIFDSKWLEYMGLSKNRACIWQILKKMNESQPNRKYRKPIIRAICDLLVDYKISIQSYIYTWPITCFKHLDMYQILIEEYGLTIDKKYFDAYKKAYPMKKNIIEYFDSIMSLSEKSKSVVVPELVVNESIRELPLELIDIIAGYVTEY